MAIALVLLSMYLMYDGSGLNWQAREVRAAMDRRDEIRDRPVHRRRRRYVPTLGGSR